MKQFFRILYKVNDSEPITAIIGIDDMPSEYESVSELRTTIAKALTALAGV